VQVLRDSEPNGQPIVWSGRFVFEIDSDVDAELTPPTTPSPEPSSPNTSPETSDWEDTISPLDLSICPDDLTIASRPVECNNLAITSPAGQRQLAILKQHFNLPASTTPRAIYDFYWSSESILERNLTRVSNHGIVADYDRDSKGHMNVFNADYFYAKTREAAAPINAAIIDAYYSLDWAGFIDSENDTGRAPRPARRSKHSDEDWVPAHRIRSVQAVTKVSPFNLPRKLARFVPNKSSNLRVATVIVDEAEVGTSLESADRFNSFVNFYPAGQYWSLPQPDPFYGFPSNVCAGRICDWDVGDSFESYESTTWDTAADVWGVDDRTSSESPSPTSSFSSTAIMEPKDAKISYHEPQGAALLRSIQVYLARPEGEKPSETSEWIDSNAAKMRDIRADKAAVALPTSVWDDIAAGWIGEPEAQRDAKRALDAAIARLDWDEIDSEPFF